MPVLAAAAAAGLVMESWAKVAAGKAQASRLLKAPLGPEMGETLVAQTAKMPTVLEVPVLQLQTSPVGVGVREGALGRMSASASRATRRLSLRCGVAMVPMGNPGQ